MIFWWSLYDKRFSRYRCSKFENICRKFGFAKIAAHLWPFFKLKQSFTDNILKTLLADPCATDGSRDIGTRTLLIFSENMGQKFLFLGEGGISIFLVGVLFHIIEAQYPSNVTTRYFRVLVLFLVYSLYAPLMRRSWTATTPYRHSKLGYFFAKYGWKTFLWGSQFFQ